MKDVNFLAQFFLKREEQKLDSIMAVDSGAVKGTGKTVFSINVCKAVCKLKNYPYNMEELMVLNPTSQSVMEKIKYLPFGIPIHIDEAIFIAYKRDYNENPVKNLVKFINICRKFKKPVLLNVPSFWDLDKDIRNLCDFRATIVKRGIACIRGKHPNPEYEDLWMREESKGIIDREIGGDITDLNGVIRGIEKCKNHLFNIYFPNIPAEEYEAYEKLSMREEGKQLFLDEKKAFVLVKVLSYFLTEKCYIRNEDGTFKKINSGILAREINELIARSKFLLEFSKFKTGRPLWRSYRKDWIDNLKEGEMLLPLRNLNNNKDITTIEEENDEDLDEEPPLKNISINKIS